MCGGGEGLGRPLGLSKAQLDKEAKVTVFFKAVPRGKPGFQVNAQLYLISYLVRAWIKYLHPGLECRQA